MLPNTKNKKIKRVNIRLPEPMMEQIDKIINQFPQLNYNRQQFVESAIREKIKETQDIHIFPILVTKDHVIDVNNFLKKFEYKNRDTFVNAAIRQQLDEFYKHLKTTSSE